MGDPDIIISGLKEIESYCESYFQPYLSSLGFFRTMIIGLGLLTLVNCIIFVWACKNAKIRQSYGEIIKNVGDSIVSNVKDDDVSAGQKRVGESKEQENK